MELVNATYMIEKTGLHQSWVRTILNNRAEQQNESNHPKLYRKKDVDVIIKDILRSKAPKAENEWDIKDIKDYFGLSRSYIQLLALDKNFPKHVRKTAITGGRYARVWKKSDIENLDIHKLEGGKRQKRVFSATRKETTPRLKEVEMQFLRGFRL